MSNYVESVGHSVGLTITNSAGESFSDFEGDCPSQVLDCIKRARDRGQLSGTIYCAGLRWQWHDNPTKVDELVRLEFTAAGQVVEEYSVSGVCWRAFAVVANRAGYSPDSYLALVLGGCRAEGMSLPSAVHWLFEWPISHSPEVQRFEAAQREFNAGVTGAN